MRLSFPGRGYEVQLVTFDAAPGPSAALRAPGQGSGGFIGKNGGKANYGGKTVRGAEPGSGQGPFLALAHLSRV